MKLLFKNLVLIIIIFIMLGLFGFKIIYIPNKFNINILNSLNYKWTELISTMFFLITNSIVLFALINFLGKNLNDIGDANFKYSMFSFSEYNDSTYTNNVLIKLFFPSIYILSLTWITKKYFTHIPLYTIYLIVPLFCLFRIFFIAIILNRKKLLNLKYELIVGVLCNIIGYLVFFKFAIVSDDIFISLDEFKNEIWLLIIIFIYDIIKFKLDDICTESKVYPVKLKEDYIIDKYNKFKNKYDYLIEDYNSYPFLKPLYYAIMIIEDFNRPYSYRKIENSIFKIRKKEMTLGIMQVKSSIALSDLDSAKVGYIKLLTELNLILKDNSLYEYKDTISDLDDENDNLELDYIVEDGDNYKPYITIYTIIRILIEKYNNGSNYEMEVSSVFNTICDFEKLNIDIYSDQIYVD